MKVLICGVDGYLGWALAQSLVARGHCVAGIDNYYRREWVKEEGAKSATPIKRMDIRLDHFRKKYGQNLNFSQGCLKDYHFVKTAIQKFEPDAIVHLAEMPSAPFSMIGFDHCWDTHENNMKGTLALLFAMRDYAPNAHLIKLGTMGEYGTPDTDIPEGVFEPGTMYRGKDLGGMIFPRKAGSWYHNTKIHDSVNVEMACRIWGLKSTDIMQGVVYGTRTPEMVDNLGNLDENLCTRFDFGECFGTAINRFCSQAVIEHPMTVYGKGKMKRGFLTIEDSIQCMTLAIENPPIEGQLGTTNGYRVFNQFEEVYDVTELAQKVLKAAKNVGLNAELDIKQVENPRIENEENYYNPDHKHLLDLGYKPNHNMDKELEYILSDLQRFKERILLRKEAIMPKIGFGGQIRKFDFLDATKVPEQQIAQERNSSDKLRQNLHTELEDMLSQVKLATQQKIDEIINKAGQSY